MRDSILITGASTGIGRTCSLHLAGRGFRVFAGVRKEADAEQLVAEDNAIEPVRIDVTDAAQIDAARSRIEEILDGDGLRGLVNNAGIAVPAPLEILPIAELRRQLEVNAVGQVAVTQAFLPLLRRSQRPATIVNMSSLSGRFAFPVMGAYAASKFALEAIGDALRVELRPWKIRVVSVEPGVIATPIWAKTLETGGGMIDNLPETARRPYQPLIDFVRDSVDPDMGIPPVRVARIVARALIARRPRARYVVGASARLQLLLNHLPTRLRDWLVARSLPDYG